jgi:ParB family chromosome partitioning protein
VYRQYEEKLNSVFGSKVIIHNKDNNKGKIEINYGSRDEFERIMELIENGHVK